MGTIAQITTHQTDAAAQFLEQFKDKPNMLGTLNALTKQVQAIEDAFFTLLLNRILPTATGVNLDVLGRIVGQSRNGLSDGDYASFIAARIRLNRSSGTIPELYAIFALLTPGQLLFTSYWPACFQFSINGQAVSDTYAATLAGILEEAKAGGVRAFLEYIPQDDAHTFYCADGDFSAGAVALGAGTLTALDAGAFASWPAAGSVILDEGTAIAETLNYSSRTDTVLTLAGTTAHAHDAHAAITLTEGSGASGRGFGDSGDPSYPPGVTGGGFSSILEVL